MGWGVFWAVLVLALGVPFVLVWWKVADGWAGEKHRRFKERPREGPGPTVVRREDVER
jgi:hypothetical protein